MTIVRDPDAILRQDVVDQEELAVAMLDSHYAALHFLAYSILGDPDSADDAVQESILSALSRIDHYRAGSNLKAWLAAIVVNRSRNMLRRRKARQRITGALQSLFRSRPPQKSPEKQALKGEAKQDLWSAVDKLGDKHRLPIILRYVHNLGVREIAEILGTREGTIHSRLHRACIQLRRQLTISDHEELIKEFLYE